MYTKVNGARMILILSLLGVGLVSCKANPTCETDPVTITMAAGSVGKEFEVLKEQVAIFQARHPHIQVELIEMPESTTERHTAYVARLTRADPSIDIYMIDVISAPEFGAKGWTIPLDGYVAASGINMDDFIPGSVQANVWSDQLVAMPWFTDAGLLYYRQDLLEKYGLNVPQTWVELVTVAETIVAGEKATRPDMVGFVFQGRQYEGLVCNYLEYVWGNGADVLSESGERVVLDSPQAVEALETFAAMQKIAPVGSTVFQEEDALNYFRSGNAVFMRNWPYAWALLKDDLWLKGKVGSIAPLPRGPSGTQGASTLGGWQLGISAYSQHPDQAFEFIAFLTSLEQQIYKAVHAGHNPTRKAAYQDAQVLEANPHLPSLYDIFVNARPRPIHPRYPEISDSIQRHVHSVLRGEQDAASATTAIAVEIQRIISADE
jgi:multiple sugar transport system substrate-binding protein